MKSRAGIIGFMLLLTAVFGSVVTGIYIGAAPVLARNAEFLQQRALVQVFALADPRQVTPAQVQELIRSRVREGQLRQDPQSGWTFRLLEAYADADMQQLQAYGFRFHGLGFWGPIEGIMAVSPDLAQTVGLVIVLHSETPGLGGRITEPEFLNAFRDGIDITPPEQAESFIRIRATAPPPGTAAAQRHVDAITGATQTSIAMERILNQTLQRFHRAMQAPPLADAEVAAASVHK